MTEKLDLSEAIHNAVAAKAKSGDIEKVINEKIGKLVEESVEDALRSYSNVGKTIKQNIDEALKVDRLDVPSYGIMIAEMLKIQIEATVAPILEGRLKQDVERMLEIAPKSIKLSEIVEEMVEQASEEIYHGEQAVTCIVETTDYGSVWIYLDDEPNVDKRSCKARLFISSENTIKGAFFDGKNISDTRSIGFSYGIEQKIRSMYACQTVIEVDEDSVSTRKPEL